LTFKVMNKVMKNLKKLSNSIVIQQVNEYVIILTQKKIQKGQFLLPFFFTCRKIISNEYSFVHFLKENIILE